MKGKSNFTKIIWKDAVTYTQDSIIPKVLPTMETAGELYKETSDYIILKSATTVSNVRKKKLPRDKVSFYFIPRAMIVDIQKSKS